MSNQQVAKRPAGEVKYQANGQDITLNYNLVRSHLVRGNAEVTDTELLNFIAICKYNKLNPFLNEAYLIKFKGTNPSAQMIVSKEAFMKRAEASPEFEGMKAGIIVKRGEDIVELEGTFCLDTDVLVGAWAEVYRKDRKFPYRSTVSLKEYNKGISVWKEKPSTMIRKTAIVHALREAFPAQLGAMYTQEETHIQEADFQDVSAEVQQEVKANANKEVISIEPEQKTEEVKSEAVDTATGEIAGEELDF